MNKIRYYLFTIKWLYHNREWTSPRQKYKALDRAWKEDKPLYINVSGFFCGFICGIAATSVGGMLIAYYDLARDYYNSGTDEKGGQ